MRRRLRCSVNLWAEISSPVSYIQGQFRRRVLREVDICYEFGLGPRISPSCIRSTCTQTAAKDKKKTLHLRKECALSSAHSGCYVSFLESASSSTRLDLEKIPALHAARVPSTASRNRGTSTSSADHRKQGTSQCPKYPSQPVYQTFYSRHFGIFGTSAAIYISASSQLNVVSQRTPAEQL